MLTPGQHKVLTFIRAYLARHGHAPSLAEIALGIGIRSKGAVHRQVRALAQAGHLTLAAGRKYGMQLVDTEAARATFSLPLAGRIAAGRPIEAIPDQDILNLAEFLLGPNRYALLVIGDSMMGAGILNGDTVVIERCDTAKDGDIVVALIDRDEATLKRLRHRTDGSVALIPENPDMPPMIYSAQRVAIQGVVVGQLRRYR